MYVICKFTPNQQSKYYILYIQGVDQKKCVLKKRKSVYRVYRNFFILLVMVFFQKIPTMADFRFLRTHFFLVHPVYT